MIPGQQSSAIRRFCVVATLAIGFLSGVDQVQSQGLYLSTAGPVNRAMGGASAAAPINAIGAIYWNPATISGLEKSELEIGAGLLLTDHTVTSTFGPFTGSTRSEAGVVPVPNIGWVYHTEIPAVTLGLGINTVAGFKTNLPSDNTNPVLAPQAANGLGRVSGNGTYLQFAPVVSVALTDNLSVAAGPTLTMAELGIQPFVFDTPNANGYAPGKTSRWHWGGGAQAGVYYIHPKCWHFGASVKSPQWMETFRFFTETANGESRVVRNRFDLPLIVSVGTAYSGFENWLLSLDVRYFDYKNTAGFGDPAVFDANGKLGGLGWDSVFAASIGSQLKLTECAFLRAGYTYNQSPISNADSMFAIGSPLIYQHMLSCGGSYKLTDTMSFNLAYSYLFDSPVEGPIVLPGAGAIPGTSVRNELTAHMLSIGLTMQN